MVTDDLFKMWADGAKAYQQAGQDMANAWVRAVQPQQNAMDEGLKAWSDFVRAWAPGWDPASATLGMRDAAATQNAFFQAFDPSAWMSQAPDQMRKIMAHFTHLPQFADFKLPGMDQAAWGEDMLAYSQAAQDFGNVMQDAWLRAYGDFTDTYGAIDWSGANVEEMTQKWLSMADAELLRTQASRAFMDAQKSMIQASTQLKKRQSEMANKWAKDVGLPTQEDVDDLARMVTELRRELRQVKTELATKKG
ncbi:MAG: poly(R)-hydroxyalkanoic acid synthase subunit PhaE [Pseudomonadota bacterium]